MSSTYSNQIDDYLEKFRKQRRESVLNTIPLTHIENWLPENQCRGLYGRTYLGSGKIDLSTILEIDVQEKYDTDVHESTHTTREEETRARTAAKVEVAFPVEKKYEKTKEYNQKYRWN